MSRLLLKRRALLGAGVALIALHGAGFAAEASDADAPFLKQAASLVRLDIEAAQMASQRGSNDAVKNFARRMIDEQTATEAELKALMAERKIPYTNEPKANHKAVLTALGQRAGVDFDQGYLGQVGVTGREDAIRMFGDEGARASDPAVRAWAEKVMPRLQTQLAQARTLQQAPAR